MKTLTRRKLFLYGMLAAFALALIAVGFATSFMLWDFAHTMAHTR